MAQDRPSAVGAHALVSIGTMQIWDRCDLLHLQAELARLVRRDQCRLITVDTRYVEFLPSGFFGLLYDFHDEGVRIRLQEPRPRLRSMIWFRQFFQGIDDGLYGFRQRPREILVAPQAAVAGCIDPPSAHSRGKTTFQEMTVVSILDSGLADAGWVNDGERLVWLKLSIEGPRKTKLCVMKFSETGNFDEFIKLVGQQALAQVDGPAIDESWDKMRKHLFQLLERELLEPLTPRLGNPPEGGSVCGAMAR